MASAVGREKLYMYVQNIYMYVQGEIIYVCAEWGC
jgi:hypothetical protein